MDASENIGTTKCIEPQEPFTACEASMELWELGVTMSLYSNVWGHSAC